MSKDLNKGIISQKSETFDSSYKVDLYAPCTVGNGILRLDATKKNRALSSFSTYKKTPVFFIPASGSGSRMFKFLFEWLLDPTENKDEVDAFISALDSFPFYSQLFKIEGLDIANRRDVISAILSEEILNLPGKPKGLIPFHVEDETVYNAFQEHVRQACTLLGGATVIHFTIQKEFEAEIKASIQNLGMRDVECKFSYQQQETDAFCFAANGELIEDNGVPLRRPAGHGALLGNLNSIDNDIILIKNIDNVQHQHKSELSIETWKMCVGLLLDFKADLGELGEHYSNEALLDLNERYQFLSEKELASFDTNKLMQIASRPTRVCGMVKNEGEPGGGPFWIKDKGTVSKQIIEKVQIPDNSTAQMIVKQSSHFNPVFMVVSKSDVNGDTLDLDAYKDSSKYFVVNKSHKGADVHYRELPGLWNGSMSNWNTIFVEIPLEVFSPVKTLNDLNKSPHQP